MFRKAQMTDLVELVNLYEETHDYLARTTNYPGWSKGIYPVSETAAVGIEEQNLYVLEQDGKIIASGIIRHRPEAAYAKVQWGIEAETTEVGVIYTFVVHPAYLQQGIAQEFLELIQQHCKKSGDKAIRLDVYEKNAPAIRLYEKCNFQYKGTVDLGLREYGLENFHLYEKIL